MRRPPTSSGLYRSSLAGSPCSCETGLSGIWSDFVDIIGKGSETVTGTLEAKAARLESALTVITVLAGVAAAASVLNLVLKRR